MALCVLVRTPARFGGHTPGGGAGLPGLISIIPLLLVTAALALVIWGLLRIWPRCRFRGLNAVRALLLGLLIVVAGLVYVLGSMRIVGYFGDRGELPSGERYVCVIVCDGANLKQARDLLMEGLEDKTMYSTTMSRSFPTISRYFIQRGAFTANGLSVWPSSSVPAHTGIMTGCYPRRTGVMGQRQFNPAHKRHISYIGLGILMLGKVLPRDVRTLPEYFPEVRSLIVLQIANRGASLYVPTTPHDEEVVRRSVQVIELSLIHI